MNETFRVGQEKQEGGYESNVAALATDLTETLGEGVIIARVISTQKEPKFDNLLKPGGCIRMKATLIYEQRAKELTKKKCV